MDDRLAEIIKRYNLNAATDRRTSSVVFVQLISERKPWLRLDVQYVNDEIYCVHFLNNEFFEIANEQLYGVIELIMKGNYAVKKSAVFRKLSINLAAKGRTVYPERTTDDKQFRAVYSKLPAAF